MFQTLNKTLFLKEPLKNGQSQVVMYIFGQNINTHLQVLDWKPYNKSKAVKPTDQRLCLNVWFRDTRAFGHSRFCLLTLPCSSVLCLAVQNHPSFPPIQTHTHWPLLPTLLLWEAQAHFSGTRRLNHMVMRSSPGWNTHIHASDYRVICTLKIDLPVDRNIEKTHTCMHRSIFVSLLQFCKDFLWVKSFPYSQPKP